MCFEIQVLVVRYETPHIIGKSSIVCETGLACSIWLALNKDFYSAKIGNIIIYSGTVLHFRKY